jgi:hypothetical protein
MNPDNNEAPLQLPLNAIVLGLHSTRDLPGVTHQYRSIRNALGWRRMPHGELHARIYFPLLTHLNENGYDFDGVQFYRPIRENGRGGRIVGYVLLSSDDDRDEHVIRDVMNNGPTQRRTT